MKHTKLNKKSCAIMSIGGLLIMSGTMVYLSEVVLDGDFLGSMLLIPFGLAVAAFTLGTFGIMWIQKDNEESVENKVQHN